MQEIRKCSRIFIIIPEHSRMFPNVLENSRLFQNILEEEVVDARAKLWTARSGLLQQLLSLQAGLPGAVTIQAGVETACEAKVAAEEGGPSQTGEGLHTALHAHLALWLLLGFLLSFRACSGPMKIFSRVAPCLHRSVRWPEPIDFKYESNQRYLCAMTELRMPKRRLAPEA
jgi:hypothetical protein